MFRVYDSLGREQRATTGTPPGAWEFLEKKTASASANIDFDLPAGFDAYKVVLRALLPANDVVNLFVRESDDGGTTFEADAGDYGWARDGTSVPNNSAVATAFNTGNGNDTKIEITSPQGNVSGEHLAGVLYITSPRTAGETTRYRWHVHFTNNAATPEFVNLQGSGQSKVAAVNDAIRFLYSAGNISSGDFILYGLRESAAPGKQILPLAFRSRQVFTANDTWNRPPDITKVYVEVLGGGGAGGGAVATAGAQAAVGGGGGSGGYGASLIDVGSITTSTITVGAGGTGVSGAAGNNGAASSWSDGTNTVTGGGGTGGVASIAGAVVSADGGDGAALNTDGDINFRGQGGESAVHDEATFKLGGRGGNGYFGGSHPAGSGAGSQTGNSAEANSGAGGQGSSNGASQAARAGGAGGSGIIVVWEFA